MNAAVTKSSHDVTTILVDNLADHAREDDIRSLFGRFGSISEVRLIPGAASRRADAHCYVKMRGRPAKTAISALNGAVFMGAILRVSEAHAPTDKHEESRPVTADEQPRLRLRLHYQVVSVEKARMPTGTDDEDWYRYVLSSGSSRVTGFRRGSREEVEEYASHWAEELNSRSISGKSPQAVTPLKKK